MKVDQQLKPIETQAKIAAKPLRKLADDYMIEGEIGEVTVDTDAHFKMVAEDLLNLKKIKSTIEEKRDELLAPAKKTVAAIRAMFNEPLKLISELEAEQKRGLSSYIEFVQQRAQGMLEKAVAKQDISAIEEAQACTHPAVTGVQVRTSEKVFVVDESLIPREYLIPNMKAIKAAKGVEIPGVERMPSVTLAVSKK